MNGISKVLAYSLALSIMASVPAIAGDSDPLVTFKKNKLVYHKYANEGQTNKVNKLIDFSYAGFSGGGKAIPTAPVKETIPSPSAVSPEQQRQLIQDAIDRVASLPKKNGLRGAVELGPGRYEISGSLVINSDGVVLRGAGQGSDEASNTIIVSTDEEKISTILLEGEGSKQLWQTFKASELTASGMEINTSDSSESYFSSISDGDSFKLSSVNVSSLYFVGLQMRRLDPDNVDKSLTDKFEVYLNEVLPENLIGITDGHIAHDKNMEGYSGWMDENITLDATLEGENDLIFVYRGADNLVEVGDVTLMPVWQEIEYTRQDIINNVVPSGSLKLRVSDASGFSKGNKVVVVKTVNDQWIEDINAANYNWHHSRYDIPYERVIKSISGNELTLDLPIVDPIEKQYGGGHIYKYIPPKRIAMVGVESIRFESQFDPSNPKDEEHAWEAVSFKYVENSWVRDVTAQYFATSLVRMDKYSRFNTIQDVAMLDPVSLIRGGRRYAFALKEGAYGNLFQRCYSNEGRHDFVTGRRTVGPNVWLDCVAQQSHDESGPHGRWATGSLFDRLYVEEFNIRNRGRVGSGQGWSGVQNMFWNGQLYKSDKAISGVINIQNPVGARNWAVGTDTNFSINPKASGYFYSMRKPVKPSSLYLQQLKDRKGNGAVNQVTTSVQRDEVILPLLKAWRGEGALPKSLPADLRPSTGDSYVRQGLDPSQTDKKLLKIVNKSGNNNDQLAYVKFAIDGIAESEVIAAKLHFNVKKSVSPRQVEIFAIPSSALDWSEDSLSWDNKPQLGSKIATVDVKKSGWYKVDLTEQLIKKIPKNQPMSLAILVLDETSSELLIHSSASKKNRGPKLEIVTYTP